MLIIGGRNGSNDMLCAQQGVALIIALIVLLGMTLAAIGLIRSVDTANMVVGNLAFQQSATHSADVGVETAISWLQANTGALNSDDTSNGYFATASNQNPNVAIGQSWDAFWKSNLAQYAKVLNRDQAGNVVHYVIHRQCSFALSPTQGGGCASSPEASVATGNAEEAGEVQLTANASVYYRITVRVTGPRNTVSYVQVVVSF